ncbi:MAG: chlorite dismutase family protein [Candidatus Omnitrophica bacterium]|nr:chlorite dismutase family protein [Candidatus Omnitrophota bacterium]
MEIKRQFVNFRFFRTLPEWRRLPEAEKKKGFQEFEEVVKRYQSKIIVLCYSLIGIRSDADFLLWRISERLEDFNEMSRDLLKTGFGKYVSIPYSYLAVTKRSMYVDKHQHQGSESSRERVVPGKTKYLFVYPFIKQREWYLLSKEDRQKIMDVHIAMGHKYPSVKINTTYSFGIDDQEFVVAFESDIPMDFVDLVMDLRETQSSKYTVRDTPAFTCIQKSIGEVLKDLG